MSHFETMRCLFTSIDRDFDFEGERTPVNWQERLHEYNTDNRTRISEKQLLAVAKDEAIRSWKDLSETNLSKRDIDHALSILEAIDVAIEEMSEQFGLSVMEVPNPEFLFSLF